MANKLRQMSRFEWDKLKKLNLKNVARDFSIEVAVVKKLPSGNYKILHPTGHGPERITYEVRILKKEGNALWLHEPGSACNSYVLRL